jgi:hypothetical protein
VGDKHNPILFCLNENNMFAEVVCLAQSRIGAARRRLDPDRVVHRADSWRPSDTLLMTVQANFHSNNPDTRTCMRTLNRRAGRARARQGIIKVDSLIWAYNKRGNC